jgi:penicillin-binding protein 2
MWRKLSTSLDKPFINKLTHGLYPPGSIIKTGLGLVYITTKVSPSKKVDCTGAMPLGKRVFRCWRKKGHKRTDITKAIRESCDVYFYKGSIQVGIKTMSEGLMRYGLGKKTGIDLPNEFIGTVPSRVWKRKKYNQPWYIGETVNTSIGQGNFLVTPIQMARFTALMATGKLPKLYLANKINSEYVKPKLSDVLNIEEKMQLPIIQNAMYEVCNAPYGTARNHISSKITIAGKTGTAQVVAIMQDIEKRQLEHEMEYYTRSHAWFTSYGPYNNPQYVVSVLVEHGGHGGSAGGLIASKIYNKLLELGYIKKNSFKQNSFKQNSFEQIELE